MKHGSLGNETGIASIGGNGLTQVNRQVEVNYLTRIYFCDFENVKIVIVKFQDLQKFIFLSMPQFCLYSHTKMLK